MYRITARQVALLSTLYVGLAVGSAVAAPSSSLYPEPENGESLRARDIKVSVDGNPAFVYSLMHVGVTYGGILTVATEFVAFELRDGRAQIVLSYIGTPVNSVRIRQLGVDVPVERDGTRIKFAIDRPGAYEIEVNHDLRNRGPVVIFANPPDNWKAVRGDISFKPGAIVNAGILHVTRHRQRIHIPGGAVVRGALQIDGASDVEISGHGIVLFDDETADLLKDEKETSPILAMDAKQLTINGLVIVVAPTSFSSGPGGTPVAPWTVHVMRSSGVLVSNVNIINLLRDGLDIDGSDHVVVDGGFIQALDDAVCVKATNYGPGGGARDRAIRDIMFKNLMVSNTGAGAALAVGTELHTDIVSGITFQNIDILHALAPHGTAISLRNGDRARVENVLFDHVNVLDRPGTLLKISVESDGYKPDVQRGNNDGVMFRNLDIRRGDIAASRIDGLDDGHTVRGVIFTDSPDAIRASLSTNKASAPLWSH